MKAARTLLARSDGGIQKMLLPPASAVETLRDAFQGWWKIMMDQSARDAYEKAVEKRVIKDSVLENAPDGTILTYSLFHNLQNPLFSKHKFDAEEFVHAVGPALENFRDTLELLRNDMPQTILDEKRELGQKPQSQSSSRDGLTVPLYGVNRWRQQAEENADSLAGRLAKMVSDTCLDSLYYTSKVDSLAQSVFDGPSNPLGDVVYVPGSAVVSDLALLKIRAMVVDQGDKNDEAEHPEFRASEVSEKDLGVAAQVDVLFESSHKLTRRSKGTDVATTASIGAKEQAKTTDDKDEVPDKENSGEVVITYTNMAVAVFEGWLHNPKSTDVLRWKISDLRDPYEFPEHQATITRRESS